MVRLEWSKTALEDIKNIAHYIEKDSIYYAKLFVRKLYSSVDRLQYFPESGRIIPEYHSRIIREIIYHNYRILYEYKENIVRVLTIVHCAKRLN